MNYKLIISGMLSAVLCVATAETDLVPLKTDKGKLSYAIGMMTAKTFRDQQFDLDAQLFVRGFMDVMDGNQPALSEAQAQQILQQFEKEQHQQNEESLKETAAQNLKIGEEFLAKNKNKIGVKTLNSGLQYQVLTSGKGESPRLQDSVTVDYEGRTINGNVFDSSYSRGKPATFVLGQVIKGWQEGLQLMKPGATWELYIPANLAYGASNVPNIGPNQVLIFKVKLISVKKNP